MERPPSAELAASAHWETVRGTLSAWNFPNMLIEWQWYRKLLPNFSPGAIRHRYWGVRVTILYGRRFVSFLRCIDRPVTL